MEQEETSEGVLRMLQAWNKNGYFSEPDVKGYLASLCIENISQPEETFNFQPKSNNDKSIVEIQRQCEIIKNTLKILNKLDNVVRENPLLLQLQNDLEKVGIFNNSTLMLSSSTSSQDQINANDVSSTTLEQICCENSENQTPV